MIEAQVRNQKIGCVGVTRVLILFSWSRHCWTISFMQGFGVQEKKGASLIWFTITEIIHKTIFNCNWTKEEEAIYIYWTAIRKRCIKAPHLFKDGCCKIIGNEDEHHEWITARTITLYIT